MTRRQLPFLLPALAALANAAADAQTQPAAQPVLHDSAGFTFDQLPVKRSTGGAATRPVLEGHLPTGEFVEIHETTLLPGQMPHAAHKHVHCEFMLIREGTVQFTANDVPHQLGPGGIGYAASNQMHGLKNIGNTPANYFVIAIGTEPNPS